MESSLNLADDIISFLDSEIWTRFKQCVPFEGSRAINNLINDLYQKIQEGEITIENIFQEINYFDLVNSFLTTPNENFLCHCLKFYNQFSIIEPFLENIFINAPDFIIKCLDSATFTGDFGILITISHITVFLLNYNPLSSIKLRQILLKIPSEISISEIFSFANLFKIKSECKEDNSEFMSEKIYSNEFRISEFAILLHQIYSKNEIAFWNIIKTLKIEEDSPFIELVKKSINYDKDKLNEFFLFLDSIPMKTAHNEKDQIVEKSNPSLLEIVQYFEQSNSIHQVVIDLFQHPDKQEFEYLVKSIENSNEISSEVKQNFLNKLRSMNMISSTMHIEKLALNFRMNDQVISIDQVIEYIERSTVGCEQFANKLFNIFHTSFCEQTEQTVKSFVDQFYLRYLNKLQFQTLNTLAEIAVEFLCSNLIQQHRISLSALAIRLPISKFINKFFFNESEIKPKKGENISKIIQKGIAKELQIIECLHQAAIQTCHHLKLNANGYTNSQKTKSRGNCSLSLVSSDNSNNSSYGENCKLSLKRENLQKTIVGFDRKIILRLRWRTLRGDTANTICFFPEFLQLCESDEKLFLKWENSCYNPIGIKRSQILMKLGITSNHKMIPELIYEVLRIESDTNENLVEILNPIFSNNIDYNSLKIPENPNISTLFRFDFLWCTSVMCHPKICKILRNPSEEISSALLRSLLRSSINRDFQNNNKIIISDFTQVDENNTKFFDQLFTTFPLGFSAILANSPTIGQTTSASQKSRFFIKDSEIISKFKKPPQLISAEQILNDFKKPSKNMPRYLIVSVAFEFAKRKNLLHLASISNGDQLWIFFCFFYSITMNMFDVAVKLLQNFDFLFDYLHKGVSEENLFAGPKKWTKGLIQFSTYCSNNHISFEDNKEWILFNDIAQNAVTFIRSSSSEKKKEDLVGSENTEWLFKTPINESSSSSPHSSQTFSPTVFENKPKNYL